MERAYRYWVVVVLGFLFLSSPCLGNPVVSFPFTFRLPGVVGFLLLFIPILLVEGLILKFFMWKGSYFRHVHLVFYPNLISSVVGSIVFQRAWGHTLSYFEARGSYENLLSLSALVLGCFYLLAVMVEFPVIWYLYSKKISTLRALIVCLVMNFVSYSLLLIVAQYL